MRGAPCRHRLELQDLKEEEETKSSLSRRRGGGGGGPGGGGATGAAPPDVSSAPSLNVNGERRREESKAEQSREGTSSRQA